MATHEVKEQSKEKEVPKLVLPYEDKEEWSKVEEVLRRPLESPGGLDAVLNEFHMNTTRQKSNFFSNVSGSENAGEFDFEAFWKQGVPLMVDVALEMPTLFAGVELPLLLKGANKSVTLTRRQCACLLAHSFFGSITAKARAVSREKWAFRASQLFFLEAMPSALCFLNYFKVLGQHGIPEGTVSFERMGFPRGSPPWKWEKNAAPLCDVQLHTQGAIEDSPAELHADFANRFVGGGCLENDFNMEEILFAIKPELIVAMALCSYMHDEEAIRMSGALQYSCYSGYGPSFRFAGDYDGRRKVTSPATVCAMDALQGCAKIQFQEGLVRRDLNKARLAFHGARSVATGNWGCGAFGNDRLLKFLQQWLAASEAGVRHLHYHIFGDEKSSQFGMFIDGLKGKTVGNLWVAVYTAAQQCVLPGPGNSLKFYRLMEDSMKGMTQEETNRTM